MHKFNISTESLSYTDMHIYYNQRYHMQIDDLYLAVILLAVRISMSIVISRLYNYVSRDIVK